MTNEELKKFGKALAGSCWQSHFSEILDINPRTVRRWASGNSNIPNGVLNEIKNYYKQILVDNPDLKII